MKSEKRYITLAEVWREMRPLKAPLPMKPISTRTKPAPAALSTPIAAVAVAARATSSTSTSPLAHSLQLGSSAASSENGLLLSRGGCRVKSSTSLLTEALKSGNKPSTCSTISGQASPVVSPSKGVSSSSAAAGAAGKTRSLRRQTGVNLQQSGIAAKKTKMLAPALDPLSIRGYAFTAEANTTTKSTKAKRHDRVEPTLRRQLSLSEDSSHIVGGCGDSLRGISRDSAALSKNLSPLDKAIGISPGSRRQKQQKAPKQQQQQQPHQWVLRSTPGASVVARGEDALPTVPGCCSYVGAAVGSSGQKPFIRLMSRRNMSFHVMPSLASRKPGEESCFSRTLSTMYDTKIDVRPGRNDTSVVNKRRVIDGTRMTSGADHADGTPAGESKSTMKHHPLLRVAREQYQQNHRRPSTFACTYAAGLISSPSVPTTITPAAAAPAAPFTRQVSQLCLTILRERDRRRNRVKTIQEKSEATDTKQEQPGEPGERRKSQQTPPPQQHQEQEQLVLSTPRNPSANSSPPLCPEKDDEAKMSPCAAVLECMRSVLEKRRLHQVQHETGTTILTKMSPCAESNVGYGASIGLTPSETMVTERSPDVSSYNHLAHRHSDASSCTRNYSNSTTTTTINITNNNREENSSNNEVDDLDEVDDDETGDEDTLWCFDIFWCGPFERAPPPPSFVPPLDLACVRVPDDLAALTTYIIPLPTPTTAFARGCRLSAEAQGCDNKRVRCGIFTDTSDALAYGRGVVREAKQRAQKERVKLLLLESHERRARRLLAQEEMAEWKALEKPVVLLLQQEW